MKQLCLAVFFAAFFACHVQAQETATSAASPAPQDSSLHYLRNLAKESGTMPMDAMSAPNLITPPSFPGGEAALLRFLAENIRYPEMARQNNIQGVVTLRFLVKENGSISSITVLRDIGGGCGEEAARVLAVMPKWRPGFAEGGLPARVRYTLPVRFSLEGQEQPKKKKWWQRDSLFEN